MLRIAALLAALGGTLAAGPTQAQLDSLFGGRDSPPRPPGSVPDSGIPPQPPPVQFPGQAPPASAVNAPPPSNFQPPPPANYPAPPPAAALGPPRTGIQAQPLPPPPGATLAPQTLPAQRATLPAPANPPPPQPADTSPQPDDAVITEMPTQKIENTRAVFAGLDKITGRTISFDAAVGETVQFGALQVTARVCYTRPPTEATNTDAFVQVDEVTLRGEVKRIFSGWMFAASPGLHAVEHPIYDVWLTDCMAPVKIAEPAAPPPVAAPAPAARPPEQRKRQNARQQQPPPPVAPAPAQPR